MQWVFIVGGKDLSLRSMTEMDFEGATSIVPTEDMVTVKYKNGYAVFEEYDKDNIIRDHEPQDIEVLEKLPFVPEKWIMLTYSDTEVLKSIVSDESFPDNTVIDCDGTDLGLESVFPRERLIFTEMKKG